MSKKVKNDENGSDIDEKGQNWWEMKKNNVFSIFSEKYGKMSKKKWIMINMGQILIQKVKIDEKCKKQYFFDFFRKIW